MRSARRIISPTREVRTEPIHPRVSTTALVCGSGPSLRGLDRTKMNGMDICAVSTAIREVDPTYWCFLDPMSPDYGDERMEVLADPYTTKVTQNKHIPILQQYPSMVFVPRNRPADDDGRSFMDDNPAYIYGVNQSIIMAVQFLVREGFTTLIFAGCDFNTKPDDPYCYESKKYLHRKINGMHNNSVLTLQNNAHASAVNILRGWTKVAANKGIRFLSATPGSPINEFMEMMA